MSMIGMNADEENTVIGFNDPDFSDRVLHIEITPAHSDDSDCCVGIEVESLHINSLTLAVKSPFFYKLFKNGMKESQTRELTLKINASEKKALVDLLNFMYGNTLSANTNSDLLDVLMVADKFEVSCCMRYCIQLLLKLPMSPEFADSVLELPSTVLVSEIVQPLIDASKNYLSAHFKDFNNSREEMMKLSISALEVVLGSQDLRVNSEDDVYEFILKWVRAHYLKPEERQEIMTNRLMKFLCFKHLSCSRLKEVLVCPEFEYEKVHKLVMESLFHKVEVFHASKGLDSTKSKNISGRVYYDRLVKVPQFEFPGPRRVIYFDLKKEECGNLSSTKDLPSQSFLLGGWWFSLVFERQMRDELFQQFGLFLKWMKVSGTCKVNTEVEVVKKSSNKFERIRPKVCLVLTGERTWGWPNVFSIPWATFVSNKSDYFINGILHLRIDLTIIDSQSY